VATDIAARGIDVSSISHVINYDIPDTADAYTHRIGRTGRAAKTGDAFTFITREDEPLVKGIERVLGERIERRILKDFDYKKAAPARDAEFARPPREPQRRRERPGGLKPAGIKAVESHKPAHHGAKPHDVSPRPSGVAHHFGKRTFKPSRPRTTAR
jgi:superfamily II DNA/RNA helicase